MICPVHGEFLVDVGSHLRGTKCKKCARKSGSLKKRLTTKEFIERAINVHGNKYDYSKVRYEKMSSKVCIICPEHGECWQTPINHLNGHGCPLCADKLISKKRMSNREDFVKKAKLIHGEKYDYSNVVYCGSHIKVEIICNKHGAFNMTPADHLYHNEGCPLCKESKLETLIRNALTENKILFERQKRFVWLGKQSLDFYLPEYNVAIECQGEQHYRERKKNDLFSDFVETKKRDIKKYNKCINNGVSILYFADIDEINNAEIYTKSNLFNKVEKIIENLNINKNENKVL